MSIGQVTISAADWLASRVSDRMALVQAGQQSELAQQKSGAASVPPPEENTGAQLERRERERSILAAQESYKRVAQRIKSRLADTRAAEDAKPGQAANTDTARGLARLEGLRDSPRIAATLIAADQKVEAITGNVAQARPDPVFGLTEPDLKKQEDRQAESVDQKEKDAAADAQIQTEIERKAHQLALADTPVFENGIWDDIFIAQQLSQTTPRRT